MNLQRTELPLTSLISNSQGFSCVDGLSDENLERDFSLTFHFERQRDVFTVSFLSPCADRKKWWSTDIPLNRLKLFDRVRECRAVWERKVIDLREERDKKLGGKENVHPFQEQWDLSDRSDSFLREVGAHLALAGEKLFYFLFESNADEVLRRIADCVRNHTRSRSCTITINAENFFVPWGLIYTHPAAGELRSDGANFEPEGFWGLRHVIEHNTGKFDLGNELSPNAEGRLPVCLNVDEGIDSEFKVDVIKRILTFFVNEGQHFKYRLHKTKPELIAALEASDFADKIVYFCCHGKGAGSADQPNLASAMLVLTDQEPITGSDIEFALKDRNLESKPMVFINACQGGQISTMFYETLGAELLRRRALALIGAQVDIPAVFAGEYACRFFKDFLRRDQRVRMGPLVRDLAYTFFTKHKNPLGMAYSLYRGADCFIGWTTEAKAT